MPGQSARQKTTPGQPLVSYVKDTFGRRLDSFDARRDLSRCVAWYDASTLTQSNGAALSRLPDLSGYGNDATQFTTANQPTVKTGGLNGMRTVSFPLITSGMDANVGGGIGQPSSYPQPVTYIAVFKASSGSANAARVILGGGSSGQLNLYLASGILNLQAGSTAGAGGPGLADDQWHIVVASFDTNANYIMLDGMLVTYASTQTQGANSLVGLKVGYLVGSTNGLIGELAEVIVCADRLSRQQARLITNKLAAKWGITVPTLSTAGLAWQDATDSGGQSIRVFVPQNVGTSAPLVILNHQQGGTTAVPPNAFPLTAIDALVSAGYVCVLSNNHGADSWSNDLAETDVVNARAYVNTNIATVTRTVMLGYSMGCSLSVIAAKDNKLPDLKGVYLIDPAVSLRWMYANGYTSSITFAYSINGGTLSAASTAGATSISSSVAFTSGTSILIDPSGTNPEVVTTTGAATGSGPYTIPVPALGFAHASGVVVSDYPAKTVGKDPATLTSGQLPTGLRWRAVASTADVTVAKANNIDVLAPIIAGASPAEWNSLVHLGGHLNYQGLWPADVLAFANRCV